MTVVLTHIFKLLSFFPLITCHTNAEVRAYQFLESVSDPYPQRTICTRIRTFLQIDTRIRSVSVTIVFHVFKVRAWSKQTECETTPIGGQVATGLLHCTACRLELWDSDAIFIT